MPSSTDLALRAAAHLRALCVDIDNRRVASPGNRTATAYLAREAAAHGLGVSCRTFEGLDWREDDARLVAGGGAFPVHASRFSPPCDVRAPLVAASTIEELEAADLRGRVVLLHGAVAAEQVMPKFFFYFPDHHRRLIEALEAGAPAAVVAASQPGGGDIGAGYPYALFEDGDLAFPSLYLSAEDGERLLPHAGREVDVRIVADAFTSAGVDALLAGYTHTPRDTVELVDPRKIVTVARALRDLIERLGAAAGV